MKIPLHELKKFFLLFLSHFWYLILLSNIIKNRFNLGLPLDSSINKEFENNTKHNNLIFSNGVDLIHEFFNFERKIKGNFLSKVVKKINNFNIINKAFTRVADKGIFF